MPATTLATVEEYLSHTWEPDREYIDGVVRERNVGERDHSRLQYLIATFFGNAEERFGLIGFTEQRLRVAAERFRIPDVCVIQAPYPDQGVITRPPLLVVEILSPDDRIADVFGRIADYRTFGVPNVWIIDPYERKVWEVGSSGPVDVADRILHLRVPGHDEPLRVDFNTLLAKLN